MSKTEARVLLTLALIIGLLLPGAALAAPKWFTVPAASVFINEIHYDNDGTDSGEAIEIAGPAGTDLSGWQIVLYNGAGGGTYNTTTLSGTIPDQGTGFGTVVVNYPVNGIQNGDPDGIALVDSGGNVIQFLSYEGTFTAANGPAAGLVSTDIGVSEGSSTPVGFSLQLTGTGTNYDHFTWSGPSAATFGAFNTGQVLGEVDNLPVNITCGGPLTVTEGSPASTTVTASDADGAVVDIAVSAVTPAPDPGVISISELQPAGAVGETASATVTIDAAVPSGNYIVTLTAANADSTPQTASCSLTVNVIGVTPIGEIQGVVADDDNGALHASPLDGQTVVVQGVIYEKTIARTSSGGLNYGFFIQNTDTTNDDDPNTSDGIFVFHGGFTTLRVDGGGFYEPQVGDEVVLRGPVDEFFNLTELVNPFLISVVRSGVDIAVEVPAFEANPPADLEEANRYWERRESMRALVPAGSIVTGGRNVFASTLDGEVWVMRADAVPALNEDAYARRVFRDPHPLDDIPEKLFDNGNGYRIMMGSLGIKATEGDSKALIAPARTFDTLASGATGGVYYSFGKYSVQVSDQISLQAGPDPAGNAPPQAPDRSREFSTAVYNLENLYDFRDDPFDGCDFAGNPGCEGISPPFDYVPESDEAYQARLQEIAQQIINDLHSPDIILVQEAEDQDICTYNGSFTCGTANNADGRPDTVQELAAVIESMGGPSYQAAYDRDGADNRGIVSGFLYRTDRVELLPALASDPVLGSSPQIDYRGDALDINTDVQNPKALNAVLPADVDTSTGQDGSFVFTRAPQVGLFRVWRESVGTSVFTDIYVDSNHFSSTPGERVGQRTEQASYNAAIAGAILAVDPEARIIVGGDLNVFPRPDDPFAPGDPLYPSDQLGPLYEAGLTNLYDVLLAEVPASAYSYIFDGQAQTLDQMFVSPALLAELNQVRAAHINSDWPADFDGDGPRGLSDHDPWVARLSLSPTIERMENLVNYFTAAGAITGGKDSILLDRLARAERFYENGQTQAYRSQLQAFVNQVQGFTPRFITVNASNALVQETQLLLTLP